MSTLICVSILVHDEQTALDDAREAKDAGADLVEWRIDEIFHGEGDDDGARIAEHVVEQSPLPCIVTCRLASEGGSYDGDEAARIALYEKLGNLAHPPRYLDLELATYQSSASIKQKIGLAITKHPDGDDGEARALPKILATRHLPHLILPPQALAEPTPPTFPDNKPTLILSSHDMQTRPDDLTRRVLAMHEEPAAGVTKIAYRARSIRDNIELFDLLSDQTRPMIALGMGEHGLMSRVLAPKFGAHITYATLRKEDATAPGQPTIDELINFYGFRWIDRMTHVFGVIGDPVGHSLSPLIHNTAFKDTDVNAVYLPMPVAGSDDPETSYASFKATLNELVDHPHLDFFGASVTMPHKANLWRLAKERRWMTDMSCFYSETANTLIVNVRHNGKVMAAVYNTDVAAACACLMERMRTFDGKSIAIFGHGGVARPIAINTATEGAKVCFFGRSIDRAGPVAIRLRQRHKRDIIARPIEDFDPSQFDTIINTTPIGMEGGPDPDGLPFPIEHFDNMRKGTIFFDTVYKPRLTPMLREAQERRFRIIDGTEMFIRQGAAQFALWTKLEEPLEQFTHLVRIQDSGFRGKLRLASTDDSTDDEEDSHEDTGEER
jgi:3-dehydroquinate dehydratase / shikimate dehydrogenase